MKSLPALSPVAIMPVDSKARAVTKAAEACPVRVLVDTGG
jgi:hypothetical protein